MRPFKFLFGAIHGPALAGEGQTNVILHRHGGVLQPLQDPEGDGVVVVPRGTLALRPGEDDRVGEVGLPGRVLRLAGGLLLLVLPVLAGGSLGARDYSCSGSKGSV